MSTKESALREIRKLLDVLNTWGNILVPSLPNKKETTAKERLAHFVEYLVDNEGMKSEEIEIEISTLT